MKTTLIKPFLRSRFKEPYLREFDRPRQPIDLAILAALLLRKGHEAKILDAFILKIKPEDITRHIEHSDVFVVATAGYDRWQCPNLDYSDAIETVNFIKKKYPNSRVVIIGPHGTVRPEELLKYDNIDFVIRGEPEITFMDLVKNINKPEFVKKGLCYKKNELVINPVGDFVEDLDKLPMPAYDLLQMENYNHPMLKKKNFSIVITSRNCPFGCKFCFREMYGKGYRVRTPKNVIGELKALCNKFNVKSVYFQDLEFCMDKKRTFELCNLMVEDNLNLEWGCTTRVTSVDEELLIKMKEAGCMFIAYGLETADEDVLNNLNKGITINNVRDIVTLTKRVGIKTILTYMVGLPRDSREEKSFEVCKNINPDVIGDGVVCVPYPDTPIYKKGRELGIIKSDSWGDVYSGIGTIDNPFTKKEVDRIWKKHRMDARIWRYKKEYGNAFFANPKFLARVFKSIVK